MQRFPFECIRIHSTAKSLVLSTTTGKRGMQTSFSDTIPITHIMTTSPWDILISQVGTEGRPATLFAGLNRNTPTRTGSEWVMNGSSSKRKTIQHHLIKPAGANRIYYRANRLVGLPQMNQTGSIVGVHHRVELLPHETKPCISLNSCDWVYLLLRPMSRLPSGIFNSADDLDRRRDSRSKGKGEVKLKVSIEVPDDNL